MSEPVVLSRRGLLARVFIGAWLLALVASLIARTALNPVSVGGERLAPVGVELPDNVKGSPDGSPGVTSDRLSHAL